MVIDTGSGVRPTGNQLPSLVSGPSSDAWSTRSWKAPRSVAPSTETNSANGRPVASAAEIPSIRSAPVLNKVIVPSRSVPTKPVVVADRSRWLTMLACSRAAVTSVPDST